MALNSPISFNTGGEAVNRVGQLGLNQRVTKLRKTSLGAKKSAWFHKATLLDDGESIIRTSQIIRAQLAHAASSPVSKEVAVADDDTEEKRKAREMLQAQLLRASALAPKNEVSSQDTLIAPSITHASTFKSPLKRPCFDYLIPNTGDVHHEATNTLCPSPLTVYFGYETSKNNTLQNVGESINEVQNISGNQSDNNYDGRLHSYPYKRNGPYTCPKCKHVFETSQRFAAHVSSSHYKYETKSERKKRLMAKVRGRTLRLQRVNDELTIIPDDVASASAAGNNNASPSSIRVKVEGVELVKGECGVELPLAPPPGMEKLTTAAPGAIKIKLESVDE